MSEYPPVVNDLRIFTSEYPALYKFVVEVKYGDRFKKVEKTEHDAKKLYERMDKLCKDIYEDDIYDDDYLDGARDIFDKLLKIPVFVKKLYKFDVCYGQEYYIDIPVRLYNAYRKDKSLRKDIKKNKKKFNLVLEELEVLPPSKLISQGGIEYQKAEIRYSEMQENRITKINTLPLDVLNIK